MPLTASQLFDGGVEHYDHGRYPEAIAQFDAAIDLEPELYAAWHNRALAKCELSQYPSALTDMAVVIQAEPENGAAYADRGYIYLQSGDLEAAVADLDIAVKIEPENASFLLTRGTILMQQGQIRRALANFDRALDADPENAAIFAERAALWNRCGDTDGALEDYRAAIDLDPDNLFTLLGRARLCAGVAGMEDLAAADYSRFVHLADTRTFWTNNPEFFAFLDKMPAPYLFRSVLHKHTGNNLKMVWPAAVDTTVRLCQPTQLYQDWLELQKAGQQEPLRYNRLMGLFQFYMGDPMAAYFSFMQEGVPEEAATELPDLMSAYYLIESAKRFHEPVGEIILPLLALLRAQRTVLMVRQSPSDLYYAGLIFFANGRLVEAEEFFAAAEAWLPAAYMHLQVLQLMSAEPALVESKIEALRLREARLTPDPLISQDAYLPIPSRIDLIEYFIQRGNLPLWEALPMYFYLAEFKYPVEKYPVETDMPAEMIAGVGEKLVEWLFDSLSTAASSISFAALLHWLHAYRDHCQTAGQVDPDTGAPAVYSPVYPAFMQDFRRYLNSQRESAGVSQFDAAYPLKPFFDWQNGVR